MNGKIDRRFNNDDVQEAVLAALLESQQDMTAQELVEAVKPHNITTDEVHICVALDDLRQVGLAQMVSQLPNRFRAVSA